MRLKNYWTAYIYVLCIFTVLAEMFCVIFWQCDVRISAHLNCKITEKVETI